MIGLLRGLLMFAEPDIPRIALGAGLAINLFLQYAIIKAIRSKPIDRLPPAEQTIAMSRQKMTMKIILTGAGAFAVEMLINVGLLIKQVYSIRIFAFVQLIAMALFFCYFVVSFTRLQKRQG
jgi:hypothetical protein